MERKKRTEPEGKVRTREHILADLSVNYLERLVLRCGFSVQRVVPDYGYDLLVDLYEDDGTYLNETLRVQSKASDALLKFSISNPVAFSFPVTTRDYRLWAASLFPVLLVLYDASLDEAYWVDARQLATEDDRTLGRKTIRLHVPKANVLGAQTFLQLRTQVRQLADQYRQEQHRTT